MSFLLIDLSDSFRVNDWFLSVMILTLLLMLLIMGPYRSDYTKSFMSMFRFKSPDGEISYPLLSSWENIFIFVLSCVSMGIAAGIGSREMTFVLWYSFLTLSLSLVRLMLYTIANKILYSRQIITLKPGRWNCFFVMSVSVAGLLILLASALVLFLDIPFIVLYVFACLMHILVVSGRIFKIKTTLFKNQRSNLGFILYLCAFEIAPIPIEFILSDSFFGLI